MITDSEKEILRACFDSVDGAAALAVLRKMSGYDSVLNNLKITEREECFALGRASLFNEILKAIQKKEKNGRRKQSPRLSDMV